MPLSGDARLASLTELVAAALDNDRTAWDELVRRLERLVWKVANSFGLDHHAREDVFQNTWLRLFQSIATIRDPEKLPGWLATTAANEARAIIGKQRLVPVEFIYERPDTFADTLVTGVLEDELRAALRLAFAELSERCQRILRLLTCEPPLTYAEIVNVLGVTHGYIGPNRTRCLEKLRAQPTLASFLSGAR